MHSAQLEHLSGSYAARLVEKAGLEAPPALRGAQGDAFIDEYFTSPAERDHMEDVARLIPPRNPLAFESEVNRLQAERMLVRFAEWQERQATELDSSS